jgi:hypothetical protein
MDLGLHLEVTGTTLGNAGDRAPRILREEGRDRVFRAADSRARNGNMMPRFKQEGRTVKRVAIGLTLALVVVFGAVALVQTNQETSTTVPALDAFHEVVMPMWHTAYPARDYATLRSIAPEVQAGIARIAAAKLPGILREKEQAWASGLEQLRLAGEAYAKAAGGKDDAALLAAAEKLHTAYESQVQVVRPVVPEMNAFHQTLYVVQHTYVPERKWSEVCRVSGDLQAKAEAVAKASLPARVADRENAFRQAATGLAADARALVSACKSNEAAAIENATEALHARYENLGKIFE